MRTPRRLHLVASLLVIGVTVAACSSDDDSADPSEPGAEAVVIEITEEGGQITPLGETVKVDLGREIRLVVDSDAADELHVHSEPEQSFDVKAANDQEFSFTIDAPGTYEVESHELGVVVVKLQVS